SMTYGPLPAEWSRSHPDPESPLVSCDFTSFESTMPPTVKVRIERKPCGLEVLGMLTTTVLPSVALMLSGLSPAMSVKRKAGDLLSLMTRWSERSEERRVGKEWRTGGAA